MGEAWKRVVCWWKGHEYRWRRHQHEGWEILICQRCHHLHYTPEAPE